MFGNNELENGIAEKLQALIIKMITLRLMAYAGVRERFRQQKRIAEFVTDAFFERCHITVILSEVEEYYSSLKENKTRGVTGKANGRRDRLRSSRRYRF